jgi:hypothetical protein
MLNKISKTFAMLNMQKLHFRMGVRSMHGASLFVNLNNMIFAV